MRPRVIAPVIVLLSLVVALPVAAVEDEEKGLMGRIGDALFKGRKLEKAEQLPPPPDPYDKALFDGYIKLAHVEYGEGDYRDSDAFALRAARASRGERFEPEAIESRDLPTELLNVAASQRQRLLVAQLRGSRELVPDWSAEAQLSFDCWMQEQEEDFQVDDIADCVERFDLAMEKINVVVDPTPIPKERIKRGRLVVEVFFDFDSDTVTREGKQIIKAFSDWVPAYINPVVSIIGNADQSGGENYNVELSQRRADAVVRELQALGVEIEGVFARGDQAPAVDRVDRAPERQNRRVMMIVREE